MTNINTYLVLIKCHSEKNFGIFKELVKDNKIIKNILITFGGPYLIGITLHVLELILSKYQELNYHMVKRMSNNITQSKGYNINVSFYSSLNTSEILILILRCDLAIVDAG
ncbi:MAG: hypothetical protein WCZ90_20520 [Melioribacteraceae bacterium]